MAQADFEDKVFKELDFIKKQLLEIREDMVDIDCVLTDEERKLVDESYGHQKEGKLMTFSEVKKELGL
ncbi:MAG: hypothetical protein PHV51_07165 [Methanosarcinaceae archaeon]|nr:hypothetical protein [Methanosarcinaceae archaeon]MDD4497911.1 hypothetical protein [Methanosarcinaceae archaeon]